MENLIKIQTEYARTQKRGLHFIMASVVIWGLVAIIQATRLPIETKNLLTFCCTCPRQDGDAPGHGLRCPSASLRVVLPLQDILLHVSPHNHRCPDCRNHVFTPCSVHHHDDYRNPVLSVALP